MTLLLGREQGKRRIGQQRVAGADRVDHAFGEAVDGEERAHDPRRSSVGAEGHQAALAELEDQRLALAPAGRARAPSGRTTES